MNSLIGGRQGGRDRETEWTSGRAPACKSAGEIGSNSGAAVPERGGRVE